MKVYRNDAIESLAERRLTELQQLLGRQLTPPVPIDILAERVLGLDFLWEPIDELPGEVVLGGLIAAKRLIVLNEKHGALFRAKPGLERSTKGHEMGHWDLFVDRARLDHPTLFELDGDSAIVHRTSPAGDVAIMRLLLADADGRDLLRRMNARADHADEARAVNRYAAAISMPAAMMREAAASIDRTRWPELYDLARQFDVTITALTVRLKQFDLLHVDKQGRLFESHGAADGQRLMF